MKTIVVIPDMQIPYHDPRAVRAVMNFVKDYQPDELFCVGVRLIALNRHVGTKD